MSQRPPALIVVSNRLPVVLQRRRERWRVQSAVGGLVTALIPVLDAQGGTWVGWPGTAAGNEEVDIEELQNLMAGGKELQQLSDALGGTV